MANQEHVKIIKQGVKPWNRWRNENPDIQPDLSEADLRGEVLGSANFSNTLLEGVKLARASLRKVDLRGANLNNAKLRWAELTQANLTEAELSFADLRETNLNNSRFDNADLREANLSKATLHDAILNEANLSGANLSHADLRNSKIDYANLMGANFANATLIGAKFGHTNLNEAELSKAKLNGVDLSYAELKGANLSGAILYEADLRNATFTGANLAGADFTRALADEHQFAPNQLSNKQREQLQFSIEMTVKEPASAQTDEKQAKKFGDGVFSQGVYGGKGGQEREGQRPDVEDKDRFKHAFLQFLIEEKGYPLNSIQFDRRVLDSARRFKIDLVLIIPKTEKVAAIIEFNNRSTSKILSSTIDRINRYKQALHLPNIPSYIVCPTINKSWQQFEIYKVMDEEYPLLILPEKFPSFEELISSEKEELKTIDSEFSDFMANLNGEGRRLCKRIIERAGKNDLAFKINAPTKSYIN